MTPNELLRHLADNAFAPVEMHNKRVDEIRLCPEECRTLHATPMFDASPQHRPRVGMLWGAWVCEDPKVQPGKFKVRTRQAWEPPSPLTWYDRLMLDDT